MTYAQPKLYNEARMTVTGTPGTGTITLGSAVAPFINFAAAGVQGGDLVTYCILDGTSACEVGQGVYTSAGTTLTRGTILSSSNGGAAISASSSSQVFIGVSAQDVLFQDTKSTDIASASTLNLDTATGKYITVTGTTTITAVTLSSGRSRWVTFSGALQITVGANLIGNGGGSNIAVAAGDMGFFYGEASNVVRFYIIRASGQSVVAPASSVPVTTSSTLAVGVTMALYYYSSNVADGSTVAGSLLRSITFNACNALIGSGVKTGTWRNDSNATVGNASTSCGIFTRTA